MKILFITQEIPYPPTYGIRLKTFNLLRLLSEKHTCDVIGFSPNAVDHARRKTLSMQQNTELKAVFPVAFGAKALFKQFGALILGEPPCVGRYRSRQFANAIRRALSTSSYDLIYIELLALAQYWRVVRTYPTILSTNDATSLAKQDSVRMASNIVCRGLYSIVEKMTATYEKRIFRHFRAIHVVSQRDADYLRRTTGHKGIHVAGLDVPAACFAPPSDVTYHPSNKTLFASGDLSRPGIERPLLHFLRNSFPQIRESVPDVKLVIVGRSAPISFRRAVERTPQVQLYDYVPDYIDALDAAAVVVILDATGTGQQNRLIQAMARGKPCVCSETVVKGIPGTDRQDLVVCRSASSCVPSVVGLLSDTSYRMLIGSNASCFARTVFSAKEIARQWNHILTSAVPSLAQYEPRF